MAERSPLRILYFEANEDGSVGGSHQAQYDVIRHLDREKYEPIALFYEENRFADALRELEVEVHIWDGERAIERKPFLEDGSLFAKVGSLAGGVRRRWKFLREHKIDLLHDNNAPHGACHDWLPAAKLAGVPAITSVMGPYRPSAIFLYRCLARRWDRILAISDYIEEGLLEGGFQRKRVQRIYLGVDIEAFRSRATVSVDETRRDLGVVDGEMMVSMVGNVRRWKGQAVILDALIKLNQSVRDKLKLFFIGEITTAETSSYAGSAAADIAFMEELRETVTKNNLEGCVEFLGGRLDVPDLMNAADIVLHASTRPEPFGLVVVEAMALGKAVIAADKGGPAEVIVPETGLTFSTDRPEELAEHLEKLYNDPGLREKLGSGASERVKEFTASLMAERCQDVYAEFLSPKGT